MLHRGRSYRLERTNRFNSPYDISIDSMFEPWIQLEQLAGSKFGPVKFTSVKLRAEAVDVQRYYLVKRLQVRRDGKWITPSTSEPLAVRPGRLLRVRAVLHRYEGRQHITTRRQEFVFAVPWRAAGGYGELTIGRGGFDADDEHFCFIESECGVEQDGTTTFQSLVDKLAKAARNDELRARLSVAVPSEDESTAMVTRRAMTSLPKVVEGRVSLPLRVRRR